MIRKIILGVFALGLLLPAAAQPEDSQDRAELREYFKTLERCIETKNLKKALTMVDSDYVFVSADGQRMDLVQCTAEWKRFLDTSRNIQVTIDLKHVQLQAREASAWIVMSFSCKMKQGRKWVPVSWSVRACDSLRKTPSGWKGFYEMELPANEPWTFPTTGGG